MTSDGASDEDRETATSYGLQPPVPPQRAAPPRSPTEPGPAPARRPEPSGQSLSGQSQSGQPAPTVPSSVAPDPVVAPDAVVEPSRPDASRAADIPNASDVPDTSSAPGSGSAGSGRLIGGRYRLPEKLGSGGMGTVWRAHDEVVDRDVAIKEPRLPDHLSSAQRDTAHLRMQCEARAAARIDHPSVVTVHDVVTQDAQPWIVMELVRGRSVGDRRFDRRVSAGPADGPVLLSVTRFPPADT